MDGNMFQCERCGWETTTKGNLVTHLKRKNACSPLLRDVSTQTLIEGLTKKIYTSSLYDCQYCKKKFNTYQSRWRHHKACSNRAFDDQSNDNNKHSILKTTYDNQVRNFGNENMMAVPDDFLRSTVMNLEYATLFENLHCDPDYPENHNIRIKSKKDRELEMYTQDKWKIKTFKKGIEEVMDHLNRIYQEFCSEHYDDLLDDVGEIEAKSTLRDIQCKSRINNELQKDILNTLEEYRPMLNKNK